MPQSGRDEERRCPRFDRGLVLTTPVSNRQRCRTGLDGDILDRFRTEAGVDLVGV